MKSNFGLVRIGTAVPKLKVADPDYNVKEIIKVMKEARNESVDILLFPELAVTGYSCQDLFLQSQLLDKSDMALEKIKEASQSFDGIVVIGAPERKDNRLFNSAFIFYRGCQYGESVKKTFLPGYNEFYEERWFSPSNEEPMVFDCGKFKFGIEICEDVWSPNPPSTELVKKGADIILNLSASNELIGKHQYLVDLLRNQSARLICAYAYASSGYGESSQDIVYAGNGIVLENGKVLNERMRFSVDENSMQTLTVADVDIELLRNERRHNTTFSAFLGNEKQDGGNLIKYRPYGEEEYTFRRFNAYPFVPKGDALAERCKDILNIQKYALAKRLEHTGMKAIIGVSGGSDSTWALIVAVEAMKFLQRPMTDIIGVSMPGFATSERTRKNAMALMKLFGIDAREISIVSMCKEELKALGHDGTTEDITFENVQARARTSILMNLSNATGSLVIGTGDLSELALGWCTYNADHMSMYGVNVSVPKTLIKELIRNYDNKDVKGVLLDILNTPVSPELTGTGAEGSNPQVTEDNIGPYALHDFYLYNMLRHGFGPEKLLWMAEKTFGSLYDNKKWLKVFLRRFFSQQFKRSCLPDGPKIGSISLSPRGDWRMPSDASVNAWLDGLK